MFLSPCHCEREVPCPRASVAISSRSASQMSVCPVYNIVPLMAAGGPSSFSLMKKNQKIKSAERLLCAQGLCAANPAKPGAAKIAPMLMAPASQMLYAPAAALPTIVLPDFARSFSADGGINGIHYRWIFPCKPQ
jgi:hypothetical protein